MTRNRTCAWCGQSWQPARSDARTCSAACRKAKSRRNNRDAPVTLTGMVGLAEVALDDARKRDNFAGLTDIRTLAAVREAAERAERYAAEVAVRAERRVGQLLLEGPR
jgi:hypothetical protein